ncbi:MAG: hypothetical protein IKE70_02495 [Bacilli bacterium]|nr:hypothetical protein [Bacilli bacterium]
MDLFIEIKKILKKRKEQVIFDLALKDYDESNFYFAIVYCEKIENYKVLFIPLDAVSKNSLLEEYFCYQFIFFHTVDSIKELVARHSNLLEGDNILHNKRVDSYYIDIHIENLYHLTFTQYIDRKYSFLFEIITIIFEHSPNIVSELCSKLLVDFYEDKGLIPIVESFTFDLFQDSFPMDIIPSNHLVDDISYLEKVGRRYFSLIHGKIIIVEYIDDKKKINIYSENLNYSKNEMFSLLKLIREGIEKEFIHIQVKGYQDMEYYYFCYGIHDENFLIINENGSEEISIFEFIQKDIKIMNEDDTFKEELKRILNTKYESKKVEELLKMILV